MFEIKKASNSKLKNYFKIAYKVIRTFYVKVCAHRKTCILARLQQKPRLGSGLVVTLILTQINYYLDGKVIQVTTCIKIIRSALRKTVCKMGVLVLRNGWDQRSDKKTSAKTSRYQYRYLFLSVPKINSLVTAVSSGAIPMISLTSAEEAIMLFSTSSPGLNLQIIITGCKYLFMWFTVQSSEWRRMRTAFWTSRPSSDSIS